MHTNPSGDSWNIVANFFALIVVVSGGIYAAYHRKNRSADLPDTPILLSYYTEGSAIEPIKKGTFGNLHYSAMIAVNFLDIAGGSQAALLYRVELPFSTTIHLVGIPKKTGADQLNPASGKSVMERVDLEGDYNNYFTLFCDKGMQETTRYVLDPKAMLFTLDFCQSQNWEIVGDELYFVVASDMKEDKNDTTSLQDDIVEFVKEIQPAVARPLSDTEKAALTPYNEDRRTNLKCPICSNVMKNEEHYFSCPKGDGVLLNGAELHNVKTGRLTLPVNATTPAKHGNLKCPSCGNQMDQVAYDGGSTMIDSCSNCTYRWLDAGEYKPLPNLMA